ncbi:UNKNOWN [Stylonychia lemnae]|uniref:Uncharacterized protein n=1 Tax=Stylonychia lemnae TaxID=5949 RepID=A0A078B4U2_STYLE|nr:UNKNOWN [Stylonychia lemnae]|eukprot:CDW88548.1 UNKNOWN [Stylonychia lemnae]
MYQIERTVYSKLLKLPKKVASGLQRQDSTKPNFRDKGYKDINLDVISLYERNLKPRTLGLQLDRRMDPDERQRYIKEVKQKLNLNEKILGLSSKRTTRGDQIYKDMGYLEFNKFFKNIHGQSIFLPHEMQWSTVDYKRKLIPQHEESERRIESMIDQKAQAYSKFEDNVEKAYDEYVEQQKAQNIEKQISDVESKIPKPSNNENINEDDEEQTPKTKIF